MFAVLLFVCLSVGEFRAEELPDFLRPLVPDKAPKSKNAYVTAYSGDDTAGHYFTLTLTLGYNLKLFDSSVDRVLLISNHEFMTPDRLSALEKVWTHIIVRKYVQWPKNCTEQAAKDKNMWFKLQAWTVKGYQKLFWTGNDVVFIKDPSIVFDWPAPASVLDFHLWAMARFGPVLNGDAILFEPDIADYNGMLDSCDIIVDNPRKRLNDPRYKGEPWLGPYDMTMMTLHFADRMTALPMYFQLELPGRQHTYYGKYPNNTVNENLVSIHYPVYTKPWAKHTGVFINLWVSVAEAASKYAEYPMNMDRMKVKRPEIIQNPTESQKVILNAIKRLQDMGQKLIKSKE